MNGVLCYPICNKGYSGNGPVCWAKCPTGKHDCGGLCTDSADKCTDSLKSIITNVEAMAVQIAAAASGEKLDMAALIKAIGGTAIDLANAICDVEEKIFLY